MCSSRPIGHRLTRAKEIDIFALHEETLLLREPDSGHAHAQRRIPAQMPVRRPRRALEMDSNETIKQAVMAGMGLALISRHTLELELKHRAIAVLDVVGTPVLRTWHVGAHDRETPVASGECAAQFRCSPMVARICAMNFEPARTVRRKRIDAAGAAKKGARVGAEENQTARQGRALQIHAHPDPGRRAAPPG